MSEPAVPSSSTAVAVPDTPRRGEPAGATPLRGHMPVLDGVRGLAILMVLGLHFIADAKATSPIEKVVQGVFGFGTYGVDLFFVLSGFLITGILIDSKGQRAYFRNFYVRRALRIFPLYYGVLFCVFVVARLIPFCRGAALDALIRQQAWAWLYAVNFLAAARGAFTLPYLDHFWSLAVEEHFYFFWPLFVWSCSRRGVVRGSLLVALASLLSRVAFSSHLGPIALYVLTPFRLDALCLGGFFAAVARGPGGLARIRRALLPMAGVAALFIVGTFVFNQMNPAAWAPLHEIRASMFVLLLAALMLAPLTDPTGGLFSRFFTARPLRFFGKYSYGLYVFHHLISYYMIVHGTEFVGARLIGSHSIAVFVQALLGMLASLGIAMASYHGFEKHFISLKRFWSEATKVTPLAAGEVPSSSEPVVDRAGA